MKNIFQKITELLVGKAQEDKIVYKKIRPYLYLGQNDTTPRWVFDDPQVGLEKEELVQGIDTILSDICQKLRINPYYGLDLYFSDAEEHLQNIPIPNPNTTQLHKQYEINNNSHLFGSIYKDQTTGIEGWLCPNLHKYFPEAPQTLYLAYQQDIIPKLQQAAKQNGYEIALSDAYTFDFYHDDSVPTMQELLQLLDNHPSWSLQVVKIAKPEVSQQKWLKEITATFPNVNYEHIHITIPNGADTKDAFCTGYLFQKS